MINERIKEFRLLENLKQDELAERVGVTQQTILKWEKGESEPKASQILKLAKALARPTVDLLDNVSEDLNEKIKAKLHLIERLNEDEKKTIMTILEALVIKSQNDRTREEFS
ncbi:helix-turn-helix transcriptional regulator [Aliivibrio wodanis]|uniref:helix-turn-helix transcriptional regulator n=1 Tax=Aliivibrio wodanis TaxID=80852 RepID=UPI00406C98D6